MKLASYKGGSHDGELYIVSRNLSCAVSAHEICPTLQAALNDWRYCYADLQQLYRDLNDGVVFGVKFNQACCQSPLSLMMDVDSDKLTFDFTGGRLQVATDFDCMSDSLNESDGLSRRAQSQNFLGPHDPIALMSGVGGIDFWAKIAVITADVPRGVSYIEASSLIRLVMLGNTVSLTSSNAEQGLPASNTHHDGLSAFSPVAVTPDELHVAWYDSKVHLPLFSFINDELHAKANAAVSMSRDFAELIVDAAQMQSLPAGSIITSALLSSGSADIDLPKGDGQLSMAELDRVTAPLLSLGDQIRIEMFDYEGKSIFGAIDQSLQQRHYSSRQPLSS